MKFHDEDVPKKIRDRVAEIQKEIEPEVGPLLHFIMTERDVVLSRGDQRIAAILPVYGITEYTRWNTQRISVVIDGIEVKVEADPVLKEWVALKVKDVALMKRVYAFITRLQEEDVKSAFELNESYAANGLILRDFYESKTGLDMCFIMEYKGSKVSGDINVPLTIAEPVIFSFTAGIA